MTLYGCGWKQVVGAWYRTPIVTFSNDLIFFVVVAHVQLWYLFEPFTLIVGRPMKTSMFSGGLLMYIIYDLTHYFLHFGKPFNERSRMLKVRELSTLFKLLGQYNYIHCKHMLNMFSNTTIIHNSQIRSRLNTLALQRIHVLDVIQKTIHWTNSLSIMYETWYW